MTTLCRDCGALAISATPRGRCGACGSPREIHHAALHTLSIAHVDCDAFYATIEKRDRPDLADRPVMIGGGARGVVLACCYVARLYGVRWAMPMFKALAACPDALVIRPDMAKCREVGRAVRTEMLRLTLLVEPLSIDEAFLDLGGTQKLHSADRAQLLAGLALRVEAELGITVSIGSSDNKFLAKLASDLDKPRGFAVLSRSEAPAFLADKPVAMLWGVGATMQRRLAGDGIARIGPARRARRARARRPLRPDRRPARAVAAVRAGLGPFEAGFARRPDHHLEAQDCRFSPAHTLPPAGRPDPAGRGIVSHRLCPARRRGRRVTRFRLIGVGADSLVQDLEADPPTLFDRELDRPRRLEHAMDQIRARLGDQSIGLGCGLPAAGRKEGDRMK